MGLQPIKKAPKKAKFVNCLNCKQKNPLCTNPFQGYVYIMAYCSELFMYQCRDSEHLKANMQFQFGDRSEAPSRSTWTKYATGLQSTPAPKSLNSMTSCPGGKSQQASGSDPPVPAPPVPNSGTIFRKQSWGQAALLITLAQTSLSTFCYLCCDVNRGTHSWQGMFFLF